MSIGINRGKPPLIAFADPENIASGTGWASLGTPVVTSSVSDPFGGTGAYTIDDDNGAAVEGRTGPDFQPGTTDPVPLALFIKQGTASVSEFIIRDITGAVNRAEFSVTWSGPTLALESGSGAAVDLIALYDDWYLALVTFTPTVATNNHELRLLGATNTAAATGSTSYYVRNVLVMEPLDRAGAFPKPRQGTEFLQTDGGVEDAWITGYDWTLKGTVRWIPAEFQPTHRVLSGWNGDGVFTGVGVGWEYFLTSHAWEKQTFLWVPDRANSNLNVSSYLVEPITAEPLPEQDFTRQLTFQVRSSDGSKYKGY